VPTIFLNRHSRFLTKNRRRLERNRTEVELPLPFDRHLSLRTSLFDRLVVNLPSTTDKVAAGTVTIFPLTMTCADPSPVTR
jgi:hypothetical protein